MVALRRLTSRCTDNLSADDFLPAMASVLPRAALSRLASDVCSVTSFSWREDFEDMWLFHFVASARLMAQLAHCLRPPPPAAAVAAAAESPLLLLAPEGGSAECGEAWEDVSVFEPPPPSDEGTGLPSAAAAEPRARGRSYARKIAGQIAAHGITALQNNALLPLPHALAYGTTSPGGGAAAPSGGDTAAATAVGGAAPPSDALGGVLHSAWTLPLPPTDPPTRANLHLPPPSPQRLGAPQPNREHSPAAAARLAEEVERARVEGTSALAEMGFPAEDCELGGRLFGADSHSAVSLPQH